MRGCFSCLELPYFVGVNWRNRGYDRGSREVHIVEVPVISVGNLTVGGTGKTPMVEWLAKWFRQHNLRVGLISRGYGAERGSVNDEARELEQRLPDVPHLQDPDRVAMAEIAIDELATELIILDDAFQHRRIGRDLDIVLIDGVQPFGFEHLLPRGLLREPVQSLARADIVVLTRRDMIDDTTRDAIRSRVMNLAPTAGWLECSHKARLLRSHSGATFDPTELKDEDRRVIAFCGIGNPAGFRHSLESTGFEIVDFREFPDHHRYDKVDIQQLGEWLAGHSDVSQAICTHKDLVKLRVDRLGAKPVRALSVEVEFNAGLETLVESLEAILQQCREKVAQAIQDDSEENAP